MSQPALPQRVSMQSSTGGSHVRTSTTPRIVKVSPSLTVPRAPMSSVINRPAATMGRCTGIVLSKRGSTPVASSKSLIRRRLSGERGRTAMGSAVGRKSEKPDERRIDAIESRISSMQDLFDLEKRRTEELLTRERSERHSQEDKVRQLEQDLQEQRRVAGQSHSTEASTWMGEEEMRRVKQKYDAEREHLLELLEGERTTVSALKSTLSQQSTFHLTMEATLCALRTQIGSLEGDVSELQSQVAQLKEEKRTVLDHNRQLETHLREAETLRRKVHNELQELRGNIRVFVRVRPGIAIDAVNGTTAMASIRYPNGREATQIEVLATGENATGSVTMRTHQFTFDRIFTPASTQSDVFEEVAHLTQSVLDGYNTCIFAYGQTGSGKTHTMEGPPTDRLLDAGVNANEQAGLIPRAVQMLWGSSKELRSKGWQYTFEGQMLEIYNETVIDLLGTSAPDAKHEIKHEKGRTTVTDATTVPLHSPAQVLTLLVKATARRQTASTLMNERSSRSHSIFTVRVRGRNATTMESCDAVLNLVDLAGSERLSNSGSGANPIRLKEAQCINKSLSSLADVVNALQQLKLQPGGHVPYRNSTLTWLLKHSLGGNSKTLMLLALSPLAEHLNESLCSLRFASKVNSTFVGTALRVAGSQRD
ncbi:hypothetical protein CBS101457_004149 [Exobasidium rhododendri]|nr:hypothetical protein CBS101457_004149 [Exobasidium rhododendri]